MYTMYFYFYLYVCMKLLLSIPKEMKISNVYAIQAPKEIQPSQSVNQVKSGWKRKMCPTNVIADQLIKSMGIAISASGVTNVFKQWKKAALRNLRQSLITLVGYTMALIPFRCPFANRFIRIKM